MSSFGEDLKRERELRKISLREIAETTKINVRYLDALESNDFKRLPGGVFNKGFVRAYAQHIGVDEEVMVNAYLLEEQAQSDHSPASEGEPLRGNYGDRFTSAGESMEDPEPARSHRGLVLALCAVAVVILLLLAGWMWWDRDDEPDPVKITEPVIQPTEITPQQSTTDEAPVEAAEPEIAEPVSEPAPAPAPEQAPVQSKPSTPGSLEVEITLTRPTSGRLNCDNRQVELLDGLAAGVTLGFRCDSFLLIDADDGGALLVSRDGGEGTPLAGDGVKLQQHRLAPESEAD